MRIKFYREKKGMSRAELAAVVGSDEKEIADFETGRRSPRLATAARIADALGVSLADLVSKEKGGTRNGTIQH